MLTILKKPLLGATLFLTTLSMSSIAANSIIDVGFAPTPSTPPSMGSWTLNTSCVDINENGEAACMALALGEAHTSAGYPCSPNSNAPCTASEVQQVYKWDGTQLILMSDSLEIEDYARVINNNGQIAGYKLGKFNGFKTFIPNGGRIWTRPNQFEVKNYPEVISLNDDGSYITEWSTTSGGQSLPHTQLFNVDGTPVNFPGGEARPFVISNNSDVIGGQVIQTFVSGDVTYSGNEIPEVSGTGWLYNQTELDMLPINEIGLYDIDGTVLWPALYKKGLRVGTNALPTFTTQVFDVNELGEFIPNQSIGQYNTGYFCTPLEVSINILPSGTQQNLPWNCHTPDKINFNIRYGLFTGMNDYGDIVGIESRTIDAPTVWLRRNFNNWNKYNANDLLPTNSGYTVLNVKDINNKRQIVGTCLNSLSQQVGCIINVVDQQVPINLKRPIVKISNPIPDQQVSGLITIDADVINRNDNIKKVVFKVDSTRISVDRTYPYSAQLDTTTLSNGTHKIKVVAQNNSGISRQSWLLITVTNNPIPPVLVTPPTGQTVEGQGVIQAIGTDNITVDGTILYYDANTAIAYNEVSGFAIGLGVQYVAVVDTNGITTATSMEVN